MDDYQLMLGSIGIRLEGMRMRVMIADKDQQEKIMDEEMEKIVTYLKATYEIKRKGVQ